MDRINRFNHIAKKPFLKDVHRQERLAFARANINQDWTRVLFSDEKVFHSICGQFSTGIWAWMSIDGPGEITKINGHLNSQQYIEILEDVMIPSVDISYHGVDMIFMQVRLNYISFCRLFKNNTFDLGRPLNSQF